MNNMGGGGTQGPETGDNAGSDGQGNVGQSGADSPGPVAANDGPQQNISLTGWPRQISWNQFRDVESRPGGAAEDALINPETITGQGSTREANGQWMLAELELTVVVNSQSWVVRSRKSDALRSHEQGHFDIHGIIAGRDVVEPLRRVRARNNRRLARQINRILLRARRRAQQMSNRYDEDTNHGLDEDRQTAWEQRIRNAINNNTRLTAP